MKRNRMIAASLAFAIGAGIGAGTGTALPLTVLAGKIGRASCRERV